MVDKGNIGMRKGNDGKFDPYPTDNEECRHFKPGAAGSHEVGCRKTHDDQTNESSQEDDDELTSVQAADVRQTAWRQCHSQCYGASIESTANAMSATSTLKTVIQKPDCFLGLFGRGLASSVGFLPLITCFNV